MKDTFFRRLAPFLLAASVLAATAVPAAAAPAGGHDPLGHLDSIAAAPGAVALRGWALDPDVTRSVYGWVTVDGAGRHLYAGASRPDVGRAFPGYGDHHGFSGRLHADPGRRRVCVTVSNVASGQHPSLGCREVTVAGGDPFGNVERLAGTPGGIELKGWTIDPDASSPIYLWVTVDGVGRHVYADDYRGDVGRVYPAFGPNHGFRATVPADAGAHRVCVTASNVAGGSHRTLACAVVSTPLGVEVAASSFEAEVFRLSNEARAAAAVAAFAHSPCAAGEARTRAEDLVPAENLTHAHLEPVLDACPPARSAGENLARGFKTPERMVEAWLDSPGHRANLLNPGLTQLGVGCVPAGGAMLCSQVFLG